MRSSGKRSRLWKRRVVVGLASAVLMGIAWTLFAVEDEVDRRLMWLMITVAFLVGVTDGGTMFARRGKHDA